MLKMLVGDRLAGFIELIEKSHSAFSYSIVLTTVACYMLQLYADFAGYTNIALGVGKLFGVDGPPNFHAPFAAVNVQELWRRWHMSLTSWVTDYLFTPLSMSLRELGRVGLVLCIMLNMLIIGLWHGLTLNFLVFGVLQGVLVSMTALVVMSIRRRGRSRVKSAPDEQIDTIGKRARRWTLALAGMTLTFALMSLTTIFWRSPTWDQAVSILMQVLAISPSGLLGLVGPASVSHRSRLDLHGYRSVCRRGRSRRQKVGRAGSTRLRRTGCNMAFACFCYRFFRPPDQADLSMGNSDWIMTMSGVPSPNKWGLAFHHLGLAAKDPKAAAQFLAGTRLSDRSDDF